MKTAALLKIVSGPRTFSASFHLGATHIATQPLGSRRLRRDIPHSVMHLLQKKESDDSEKKTPLKPWSILQPLDVFPTSPFRRIKRRRGCGGAGKYAGYYPLLAPISFTIICCFSLRRPNGAMASMAEGTLASALMWLRLAKLGMVW